MVQSLISKTRSLDKERKLSISHLNIINSNFTKEDVNRIIFSNPDDKAHRADGFSSKFSEHLLAYYW